MRAASRPRRTVRAAPIIAIAERVQQLRAQGIDVVSFGMGESDLGTPIHVREAAQAAIEADAVRCTAPSGSAALKDALRAWLEAEYDISYAADEVIVSPGSKYALHALFATQLDPGDDVVVVAPAWPTIAALVEATGASARLVVGSADAGFDVPTADVAKAITPRTRALYVANPSNPTGRVLSAARVEDLVALCGERDIAIVSDGAYRSHAYDVEVPNLPKMASRRGVTCVVVETVSKRYSMSGWRVGFAAGPAAMISAMTDLQGQTLSCPSAVCQVAALAALKGPQACVDDALATFARRRDLIVEGMRSVPGFRIAHAPQGAFFVFPDVREVLGRRTPEGVRIADDNALALYLLEEARVASIPGSVFGGPGHLRFAYTVPEARIGEGCARVAAAIGRLSP